MSGARSAGICLVLGAGAFRGLAHIGVLRALRHLGVPVQSVVGVSIGGLVAAFHFGLGYPPEELERVLFRLSTVSLFHLGWCLYGGGDPSAPPPPPDSLEARLGELRHLDLQKLHFGVSRMGLLALDLFSGEEVFAVTGEEPHVPAGDVALGGASIPGLFPWVRRESRNRTYRLVDGGFSHAVPVERALVPPFAASRIVAVDLQVFRGWRERDPARWERLERQHPGRILRILPRVNGIGTVFFRSSQAPEVVRAGEAAVLEQAGALC